MLKSAPMHEDLFARAEAGDEPALDEIFDRLAPRLLALSARFGSTPADDEQILGDLFYGLLKESRRFRRHGGSATAWLAFAVRTGRIEKRRAAAHLPRAWPPRQNPLRISLAWLPRPSDIARIDERRDLLNKVLRHLPKPQMQVLEMAVFDGLTESEIAEKLKQPLGMVAAELRAAFRFLRHRMSAILGTWNAGI